MQHETFNLLALTGQEKVCKGCRKVKSLSEFYARASGHKGHEVYCKPCRKTRELAAAIVPKRKLCPDCGKTRLASQFHANRRAADGLWPRCKNCQNASRRTPEHRAVKRTQYRTPQNFLQKIVYGAKFRAKRDDIPFNITVDDIVLPSRCPVLNIPLTIAAGAMKHNAPTLDRINPALGYVRGNVAVISWLANRIKGDQTDPAVFERIAAYMRKER